MLQQVLQTIQKHNMPLAPAKVLVALSGGADSVALAWCLLRLGYCVEAAHCNFHLRGEESERDQRFVADLCEKWHIPLHVQHFNTQQVATERGISIEMAARELRYAWFDQLVEECSFAGVAVAHHLDDNAETLLLNLMRGTGLRGLTGIKYRNGHVFRPLLDVGREQIEKFLCQESLSHINDSTNQDTQYRRNFVRNKVLPLLGEINPSISTTLHQTSERMVEACRLYELGLSTAKKELCCVQGNKLTIDVEKLLHHPAAQTVLYELLSERNYSSGECEMIFQQIRSASGAMFYSASHLATLHQGNLVVAPIPICYAPQPLPEEGCFRCEDRTLHIELLLREDLGEIPHGAEVCCLDQAKIKGDLLLRSVNAGDRFHPFGMKGTKLVSDYLTDRHYSVIEKKRAMVLCDDEGILWLVGERPDQRGAITNTTQNIKKIVLSYVEVGK